MSRVAPNPADELVERMGLHWELDGLPRIAGRIFGLLLLQADPCSLDDIAAALGVSKASVSVDARRLERLGLVDRVSRPGDRRDYYVIGEDLLAHALELRLESMRRLQDVILAAGRVPDTPPRVRRRLGDMARHHEHALRAVESLLDELRVPTPDTVDSTD
jgi:DNA-binding MarR family transcriptional regulator